MDTVNYEESDKKSAKMSNNKNPTTAQDDIDFETYREALLEGRSQEADQTPPFQGSPKVDHSVDPELKLKIMRQKREVYDQLRRQGLLPSGTMSTMDESYVRTWEEFNSKGIEGLGLQQTRNSDDQASIFFIALLKNYFLELSIDKVEIMCEAYIKSYNSSKDLIRNQDTPSEEIVCQDPVQL